ncbi:hypothetical protein GGI16_003623 [Coemansia sp. S142-1]|nr:hypothetical protein GGI16_003623 [Coemansia sp. S142-1]
MDMSFLGGVDYIGNHSIGLGTVDRHEPRLGDDSASFLKAIGRGCEKYTEKFKDWDHLFKANTIALKHEMGIGAKQRKWILMWTNKFRLGIDPYLIRTSKKHTMKRTERLARAKRRRND